MPLFFPWAFGPTCSQGTILLAGTEIWGRRSGVGELEAAFAKGIGMGFCGCFTTISTFALELDRLAAIWPRKAMAYATITVLLSQLALLLMNGVYMWATEA